MDQESFCYGALKCRGQHVQNSVASALLSRRALAGLLARGLALPACGLPFARGAVASQVAATPATASGSLVIKGMTCDTGTVYPAWGIVSRPDLALARSWVTRRSTRSRLRKNRSTCPMGGAGCSAKTDKEHDMHPSASRSRQPLALLATTAIVGQAVLLASALLLPLVSEYSLVGDNISELVLGRYGMVQTVAFVIAAAGTLALAYAIRKLTVGAWGSLVGSLLIGIYGMGALVVAIFPTDRIDSPDDVWSSSATGIIHIISVLVSFVCLIIGMFILTRTFLRAPRWRSLSPWSVLFPAGALVLFFVQAEGPWVGLMQRLLVAVFAAWMIVVAVRVRAIAAAGEAGTSG